MDEDEKDTTEQSPPEEKVPEADQEVSLNDDDDKDDLFSDPPLLETSPAVDEKPEGETEDSSASASGDGGGGVLDDVPIEKEPPKEEKKEEPKKDEAEEEEQESGDTYDMEITITDPQKVGDGMGAYMRYTVITKTTDPAFKSSDMSVPRRFSDFLGLHQKLVAYHTTKGHIVPPVPEKSVVGMTKVKMGKGQDESNSLEFVEKRRAALERFLNRSAAHPKIRANQDFKEFLEKEELPKASNTAALSGAGMMRAFNKVMDSASKVVSKMNESDQWFEEKTQQIDNLDQQLKKLHTSVENMVNHRRELSNATAIFAKSAAMLGNAEEHTALSRAISQLAETEEEIEQLQSSQAATDFYVLSELLKDYIGLIASVREAFREREKAFHNWQHAQTTLAKKREQEAKLKTTGKTEKLPQVQQEITDWEEKVEKGQREFEAISKTIRREVNRFETNRVQDFRSVIIKYLESLMEKQQKLIQHWEAFLPEAKAIA